MYILKWRGNAFDGEYFAKGVVFVRKQCDATRFKTRAEARRASWAFCYAGASELERSGESPPVGWVVVRLVRR